MSLSPADLFPPLGLRITAGRLEMRGICDQDIAELAEVALAGIHPPEQMPFAVPWTDAPADELPLRFAQYHWGTRASFSHASIGCSTWPPAGTARWWARRGLPPTTTS